MKRVIIEREEKEPELLGEYMNGVVHTMLYSDGTKVREVEDDQDFISDFAETMDVNISQYCENGCNFCYSNCSKNGKHADFSKYEKLFDSLHPYTELAINLNSSFHPGLREFLQKMKDKNVIVNATINQKDFEEYWQELLVLTGEKLIWGLGISLVNPTRDFTNKVRLYFPNAIIHIINGIVTEEQMMRLGFQGLKLLILGYKQVGRGVDWYSEDQEEIKKNQKWLYKMLPYQVTHFKIVSFDNLAVEQLNPKRLIGEELYNQRFMGEDGTMSFYLNLVDGYFAKNSLSDIHYPIGDKTVDECFKIIRNS